MFSTARDSAPLAPLLLGGLDDGYTAACTHADPCGDWRDDRIAELEAELAAKGARIAEQDRWIAELEKRLAQLAEQLSQNSRNSHLPPSSDTPEERWKRANAHAGDVQV